MLSWGCEPPALPSAAGAMATVGAAEENWSNVDCAQTPAEGLDCVPGLEFAWGTWEWEGICCTIKVTDSAPPVCASANPGPTCTGTRLCRLGRAKVLWPSPP